MSDTSPEKWSEDNVARTGPDIRYTVSASTPFWPDRPDASGAPNVVIVLVDDMGYSDIGCYGSEIPTPNIDALAVDGVRYRNFHAAPTCTSTRASLFTGLNPHSAGFGRVASFDPGFPGYAMEFPENVPTIASTLRDKGYATFGVGKWHLAREIEQSSAGSKHGWPLQRGFDRFYGFLDGFTNFFHPHQLVEDNHHIAADEYPEGYYLTDDLTQQATGMIKELRNGNSTKPFLLYFAHGAVHAPLQAPEADIEPFRGRYDDGWASLRRERFARQKQMGLFPDDTPLPNLASDLPRGGPDWDKLSEDEQSLAARYMEVYAAMVSTIDQSVGQIRSVLEDLGEWDNTVVLFLSDNGASSDFAGSGTTHYMLGHAGTYHPDSPDGTTDLANRELIGGPRVFPHYPKGWALACNTPYRLYKRFTHAGGHSVPLVVHWPSGNLPKGEIRTEYAHVADLLPTLLELVGQGPEEPPLDIDGVSFASSLLGHSVEPHRSEQIYESYGSRGLYEDGWEIVDLFDPLKGFTDEGWELYHLDEDPTEAFDLATSEPERLERMIRRWDQAAADGDVFPLEDGSGVFFHQRPDFHRPTAPSTFWPGLPTIERIKARDLIWNRSFKIEVDVDASQVDSGILVSHGDQAVGYVLYVEQAALQFSINVAGQTTTIQAGGLSGATQVEVEIECPQIDRWDITITVDGEVRATRSGIWMFTGLMTPLHGIDIGLTRGSPVLWDLHKQEGSFPWSGTIHRVRYHPGAFAKDAPQLRVEEFRARGLTIEGSDRPIPPAQKRKSRE